MTNLSPHLLTNTPLNPSLTTPQVLPAWKQDFTVSECALAFSSLRELTVQALLPRTPRLRHQHPPLNQHLHHPPNLHQTAHRRIHPRSPPPHPRPLLPLPPNPLDRPRPRRPHRPPPPSSPLAAPQPQIRSLHRHRPDPRAMAGLRPPCSQHGLFPLAVPRDGHRSGSHKGDGRRGFLPDDFGPWEGGECNGAAEDRFRGCL